VQFVVCAQNHDQVGNRAQGERLTRLLPTDAWKVAAMAVLLAPALPLLFMGEEYAEPAPFLYFTDHGDSALREAVREGRQAEFASFGWSTEVPDPQDPETFKRSLVDPEQRHGQGRSVFSWYRTLIRLRIAHAALGTAHSTRHGSSAQSFEESQMVVLHRWAGDGPEALLILSFNKEAARVSLSEPKGRWLRQLAGTDPKFGGTGGGLPHELNLTQSDIVLEVPAFTAALYLKT
jgi:maltooligosyltrehalose trehalohydrolase